MESVQISLQSVQENARANFKEAFERPCGPISSAFNQFRLANDKDAHALLTPAEAESNIKFSSYRVSVGSISVSGTDCYIYVTYWLRGQLTAHIALRPR